MRTITKILLSLLPKHIKIKMLMKKVILFVAAAITSIAAMAQETFTREMPCKNDYGQVIANKMGTICLPYAAKAHDCTVYRLLSASADEWIFQEVTSMEANTPYVFVVDNNTTLQASFEQVGETVAAEAPIADAAGVEGAFVGSYNRKMIRGEKMYFLSYDKINFNNGKAIVATPNRAYFKADVMPEGETLSENVKLTFLASEGGDTTGVDELNSASDSESAEIARQNIGLKQGSYKIGGKHVIVK